MSAAGYDGATSFNNIYSASLNAQFNGAEGTLLVWDRVSGAGVWTDASQRNLATLQVNATNKINIRRTAANNTIGFQYVAGGATESQNTGALSNLDYAAYAITWSKSALPTGEVRYYINGVASGATDTGLGAFVGNLANNTTVIGASITTPANVFLGDIAPVLLYNEAKSPAEVAYLSTV